MDGQNIYYLVGHSRANIFQNNVGQFQGNLPETHIPGTSEFGMRIVPIPDKHGIKLRTIPATNLKARKDSVLRIHKENLNMVTRL